MLRTSLHAYCFARIALEASSRLTAMQTSEGAQMSLAASEGREVEQGSRSSLVDRETPMDAMYSSSSFSSSTPALLWIDDTAAATAAREEHIRSAEYKELHRPALSNSEMGLFGGELGFEKAHRVWVDPDRPHMKHIYNSTALAKNIRYTRYGYFKRDMHLLDVDKLVRHARMLPTPNRLLTDFIYQRVPLPDRSCAAFLRYQRSQIDMLDEWERSASFGCAEEIFERLIVTSIPPVHVGVETHAEIIRCAAAAKKWDEGYNMYWQRALDEEAEAAAAAAAVTGDDGSGVPYYVTAHTTLNGGDESKNALDSKSFVLDSNIFDAVIELCVACQRVDEGFAAFEELLRRHLRPQAVTLDRVMILVSLQCEFGPPRNATNDRADANADAASLKWWGDAERRGFDTWALYDYFKLPRTTSSLEAYMRMGAMLQHPTAVVEAVSFADHNGVHLSLECVHWLLYAVRFVPDFGDFVVDVLSQLRQRGLSPDYVTFTLAFLYCAHQKDGELAKSIYEQFFVPQELNPTPEMTLLLLQALARCNAPTPDMLVCANDVMERLERVGSSADRVMSIYEEYLDLCAALGAVSTAFSQLKKCVGYGEGLTARMLNALLLGNANASAPNGSVRITEDVVQMYEFLRVPPSAHTVECLGFCMEAHGTSARIDAYVTYLESLADPNSDNNNNNNDNSRTVDASRASSTAGERVEPEGETESDSSIPAALLDGDSEVAVCDDPPHRLRMLRTDWRLRPRDTTLKRFGQNSRLPGKQATNVGSMLGSVTPFGRNPGEKYV